MRAAGALTVVRVGRVLEIRLSRADRLNALPAEVLDDLADLLEAVADDEEVSVVVLTGAGRALCARADLGHGDLEEVPGPETVLAANRAVRALLGLRQPSVWPRSTARRRRGVLAGAGCDLVVAADAAYFFLVFTDIGLMPDGGATALLPASLGRSRALQMALLPERIPAETAWEWGIVHRVVVRDELDAVVAQLAERLAAGAPRAYAATKRAISDAALAGLKLALLAEAEGQADLLRRHDFREAVAAFSEKRAPAFTGE